MAFDDVLGTASLPAQVPYPHLMPPLFASAAPAPSPAPTMAAQPPAGAAAAPPAEGGIDQNLILGMLRQAQSGGGFMPNFMASLGAGLNSARQNWNKPPAAAFASGAGAAIQGGQQWSNQQQDLKLKALHAAIGAWKVGDMAGYQQALALFQALSAVASKP